MRNIEEIKKTILEFLEKKGPCLPIAIAKEIEMDLVFASAIIGELTSAHKVKSSYLKIGSSPLFYLEGQENKLEPFAEENLSGVVKKAFLELKNKKALIDKEQEPAIRVALRELKDFASPFKYKEELMWRYNFVSRDELLALLENKPVKENTNTEVKGVEEDKKDKEESVDAKEFEEKQTNKENQKNLWEEKKSESNIEDTKKSEVKKENKTTQDGFSKEVSRYLEKKGFKIIEVIDSSRNEFSAKININSDLGELGFLLIARNKKSLSEQDIIVAYQKSSEQKMPCFLIHRGKLSKKSDELLKQYSNLIKIDKI